MSELFSNNAVSTLTGSLSAVATSLTVQAGHGARFPNPTASDFFRLVLVRKSDGAIEIVFCTVRSGDIFTITRAQESTTALAFVASDIVELRPTAGFFTSLTVTSSSVQNNQFSYDATDTGSANVCIIQPSPAIAAYVEGQEFWWKVGVTNTGPSTLNISALGTSPAIIMLNGSALYSGALQAGRIAHVIYNGTAFVLQNLDIGVTTPGTIEASKAVVVNASKDALGFGKITGSSSTGHTAAFSSSSTNNFDRALAASSSGATGIVYAITGEISSVTSGSIGVYGASYGATGDGSGGYFRSDSSGGYGVQAVTLTQGGIPITATAFDAADGNDVTVLQKGTSKLTVNPRASAAVYANPIVQDNDQLIGSVGVGGTIDTGVITIAPVATDAVGIRISSVTDTVAISGAVTINTLNGSTSVVFAPILNPVAQSVSCTTTFLAKTLTALSGLGAVAALIQFQALSQISGADRHFYARRVGSVDVAANANGVVFIYDSAGATPHASVCMSTKTFPITSEQIEMATSTGSNNINVTVLGYWK